MPGWCSQLSTGLWISAQVPISGSWDAASWRALCSAWSLACPSPSAPPPAPVLPCSLFLLFQIKEGGGCCLRLLILWWFVTQHRKLKYLSQYLFLRSKVTLSLITVGRLDTQCYSGAPISTEPELLFTLAEAGKKQNSRSCTISRWVIHGAGVEGQSMLRSSQLQRHKATANPYLPNEWLKDP